MKYVQFRYKRRYALLLLRLRGNYNFLPNIHHKLGRSTICFHRSFTQKQLNHQRYQTYQPVANSFSGGRRISNAVKNKIVTIWQNKRREVSYKDVLLRPKRKNTLRHPVSQFFRGYEGQGKRHKSRVMNKNAKKPKRKRSRNTAHLSRKQTSINLLLLSIHTWYLDKLCCMKLKNCKRARSPHSFQQISHLYLKIYVNGLRRMYTKGFIMTAKKKILKTPVLGAANHFHLQKKDIENRLVKSLKIRLHPNHFLKDRLCMKYIKKRKDTLLLRLQNIHTSPWSQKKAEIWSKIILLFRTVIKSYWIKSLPLKPNGVQQIIASSQRLVNLRRHSRNVHQMIWSMGM